MANRLYHLTQTAHGWERVVWRGSLILFGLGAMLSVVSAGLGLFAHVTQPPNAAPSEESLVAAASPVSFTRPFEQTRYTTLAKIPAESHPVETIPANLLHEKQVDHLHLLCHTCRMAQKLSNANRLGRDPIPPLPEPLSSSDSLTIQLPLTDTPVSSASLATVIQDVRERVEATPPPPDTAPQLDAEGCPTQSEHQFELIPVASAPTDRPDRFHADFNLALRGYVATDASTGLIGYNGETDYDAPQLNNLFRPQRQPQIKRVYQVNDWLWGCSTHPHGCVGGPIALWPVTLVGLATTAGEPIYIPGRQADIYQGRFQAMVLYASERQLTLTYTRQDTVVSGYTVHLHNVCVDPNLVALYRAQNNADGWRQGNHLPAIGNHQGVGRALGQEVQVAIRDHGMFMDPRSSKDWWQR